MKIKQTKKETKMKKCQKKGRNKERKKMHRMYGAHVLYAYFGSMCPIRSIFAFKYKSISFD